MKLGLNPLARLADSLPGRAPVPSPAQGKWARRNAERRPGERMVEAIRTKQLFTSPNELLNRALDHVYAAVHQGHPMEDWLEWMLSVLAEPMAPLNTRGKPRQQHRGQGKATPLNRAAFVAKQLPGLTRKDEQLLWLNYKKAQ